MSAIQVTNFNEQIEALLIERSDLLKRMHEIDETLSSVRKTLTALEPIRQRRIRSDKGKTRGSYNPTEVPADGGLESLS